VATDPRPKLAYLLLIKRYVVRYNEDATEEDTIYTTFINSIKKEHQRENTINVDLGQ
jgi:hypothetical protein